MLSNKPFPLIHCNLIIKPLKLKPFIFAGTFLKNLNFTRNSNP